MLTAASTQEDAESMLQASKFVSHEGPALAQIALHKLAASPTYEKLEGKHCKGRDELGQFRALRKEGCRKKCDDDLRCVSFEYQRFPDEQRRSHCQLSTSCTEDLLEEHASFATYIKLTQTTTTTTVPVCDTFFGPGAADEDQIISIVDVDIPKFYCDLFGKPAPCTYIHRASAAGGCRQPGPADSCHSYIKVIYSQCDGLDAMQAGQPDLQDSFDSTTGVLKGCEGFVTSAETFKWAPETPYEMTMPPNPPADYKAIQCSKP